MDLSILWFVVIAVLWTGFLILEGFDFGVGMLHAPIGRNDGERRQALSTVEPLWDGNEVWLVLAVAGTFAAFPAWYSTMFSAYYLVFVVVLVALIVRGVSFDFRGRRESTAWRRTWSTTMTVGSFLTPFLLAVALAGLLSGLPIGEDQEFTGSLSELLAPYTLYVGATVVVLCLLLGATYLALKTDGVVRARSGRVARWTAVLALLLTLGFVLWTESVATGDLGFAPIQLLPMLTVVACVLLVFAGREGWGFAMAVATMAAIVATLFVDLYPNVMVSSTDSAYNLTVENASSSQYSLQVMTIAVLIFLPVILLYQGWTYYVFRERVRPPETGAEQVVEAQS